MGNFISNLEYLNPSSYSQLSAFDIVLEKSGI